MSSLWVNSVWFIKNSKSTVQSTSRLCVENGDCQSFKRVWPTLNSLASEIFSKNWDFSTFSVFILCNTGMLWWYSGLEIFLSSGFVHISYKYSNSDLEKEFSGSFLVLTDRPCFKSKPCWVNLLDRLSIILVNNPVVTFSGPSPPPRTWCAWVRVQEVAQ